MTLRLIILVFGIGVVIVQFFVSLHDERTKKRENGTLYLNSKKFTTVSIN